MTKRPDPFMQASHYREGALSSTVIPTFNKPSLPLGKGCVTPQTHHQKTQKPRGRDAPVTPDCSVSPLFQGHSLQAEVALEEQVLGVQGYLSKGSTPGSCPRGN